MKPGSPPHTRGKCQHGGSLATGHGITPAYAGKMPPFSFGSSSERDHPRIRGENPSIQPLDPLHTGSPPHTRGKLAHTLKKVRKFRITPAYAGKIFRQLFVKRPSADHPRIRGENEGARIDVGEDGGSPPHTRGKSRWPSPRPPDSRITPAYAGKIKNVSFLMVGI